MVLVINFDRLMDNLPDTDSKKKLAAAAEGRRRRLRGRYCG